MKKLLIDASIGQFFSFFSFNLAHQFFGMNMYKKNLLTLTFKNSHTHTKLPLPLPLLVSMSMFEDTHTHGAKEKEDEKEDFCLLSSSLSFAAASLTIKSCCSLSHSLTLTNFPPDINSVTYVIGLDDGVRVGRLHHVFPLFMVLHLAVNVVARVRLTTGAIGTGDETAKDKTKNEAKDEAVIKIARFHDGCLFCLCN